jgi:hypothetical protein
MRVRYTAALLACEICAGLSLTNVAHGQAGPPFLTNDPGTPGNANWEINLATMQTVTRSFSSYQVPEIDLNYGLGDRIQLTYSVPYVIQSNSGQPEYSGWSNAYPGVKWRFIDQGEGGLQVSVFPQIESGVGAVAQQKGLGSPGPRYLLPVEATKKVGPFDLDLEAGYLIPGHGPHEQILGLVAGRSVSSRLELDAEIYNDRAIGSPPNQTTLDVGGRFKLTRGFIALFMVGRSVNGTSSGQPEFLGYFGIQILLSNYGRTLSSDP